jgi:predicted nuclease of predicted toxin-antitoxin system
MKLLLDENFSRRLVPFLQNAYPGTSQVVLLGGFKCEVQQADCNINQR